MDAKEKKELSESDIKAKFITPAIIKAGWDEIAHIRREVTLTPGPVVVRGNLSSRNKKKKKFADYVLQKEKGVPIAVIEAKDNNCTISHGLQQALGYADILDVPCAFSSNGDGFASHNKAAAVGEDTETEFAMDEFPSPDLLWQRYKQFRGISDANEELVTEPYFDAGGGKEPRYYQAEAINRVIEKVAKGQKRLLLVMATGIPRANTIKLRRSCAMQGMN
ncbi:MAG: DEAD/DEAH box helicase family protein [Limnohabitans sp.]